MLLLGLVFAWMPQAKAQHPVCAADDLRNQQRQNETSLFDLAEQRFNQKLTSGHQRNPNADGELRIPVVVHIIHNGENPDAGSNISYAQVMSQIDALNAAFSNFSDLPNYLQAGVGAVYNVPDRRGLQGVDTKIRFCLAPQLGPISPLGQQISGQPGVIRYNNFELSHHDMSQSGQLDLMALTHPSATILPAHKYFNIWVVSAIRNGGPIDSGNIPGIAGYAPIPIDLPYVNGWPLRGVVIRSDMFGDNSVNGNNFALQPNFTQGKVLVHEIGHALGLYHTFHTYGQASSSPCDLDYGDLVADTPPCSMATLGLYYQNQPVRNTCTNDNPDVNDMLENYMYYSVDAVRNTFTAGQKTRMRDALSVIYPEMMTARNGLETGVIGPSGCFPPILTAEFAPPPSVCINQNVQIAGVSGPGNTATSFSWSATPAATFDNLTAAATTVSFPASGIYTLTLTATGPSGQATFSQEIFATACNLNECAVENGSTHFVLGYGTHLDFRSGLPVFVNDIPSSITSVEGNFTQNDAHGNLLFYTDGHWVWNAQSQVINPLNPLSMGTPGNPTQIISESIHQMACVPFPGHPGKYVLLIPPSVEEYIYYNPASFKYAIVDTSTTPETVSGPEIIRSSDTTQIIHEAIATVPHCNGRDCWVMISQRESATVFSTHVYLLSAAGLKLVNTYNTNAPTAMGFSFSAWQTGMHTSRDGSKVLVYMDDRMSVLDFDTATGVLGNPRHFMKNVAGVSPYNYQSILSGSGNKLYVKLANTVQSYQVTDTALVLENANLYSTTSDVQFEHLGFFLGPDDNIYIPDNRTANCTFTSSKSLTRIANADATPVVTANFVTTSSTAFCSGILGGLPNGLVACRPDPIQPSFLTQKVACDQVTLTLQGCFYPYDVAIDWGDGSAPTTGSFANLALSPILHAYASTGQFVVAVTLSITAGWDDANNDNVLDANTVNLPTVTQLVEISALTTEIIGNTAVCPGSQPIQYVFPAGASGHYSWSVTGAGNSITGLASGVGINSVYVNWQSSGQLYVDYTEGDCSHEKQLDVVYSCLLDVENPAISSLVYSPNPVTDWLYIRSAQAIEKLTVFNLLGQRIYTQDFGSTDVSLDCASWQAGTYFVNIVAAESMKTIKIIKL